jgi:hypothetical protein
MGRSDHDFRLTNTVSQGTQPKIFYPGRVMRTADRTNPAGTPEGGLKPCLILGRGVHFRVLFLQCGETINHRETECP